MRKFLTIAAALALLSGPALAGSGSYITDIRSNNANVPNGIAFQMFDDHPAWYCFSARSPGVLQATLTINNSKSPLLGIHLPVTFFTGVPTDPAVALALHAEDCVGLTHVYGIQ